MLRIAPTLVDALLALEGDASRGFVFVRPDGTERLRSFQEMASGAAGRAGAFLSLGLRKGDRLVLVVPDGDEFVLSFLGALFAGIVPVPLYPAGSLANLDAYHQTVAHVVRAAGATTILTTAAAKATLDGVSALVGAEGLRAIVTVEELASAHRPERALALPGELAFIQFTSGSTSRPKGVEVTHANLAANAAAFMLDGLKRDPAVDKGVSWLPLFHDMGLIGFVVGPIFTNVPCVLLPTAAFARRPRLWLDKIHEHRGTITYAPNFAYALVARRLRDKDLSGLDLSCLRACGCGAEPIQPNVLREFAATLAPAGFRPEALLPSYGMAEGTLAITFTPIGQGLRTESADGGEIVDCGEAFPGHEVAIVDDAGRRLGDRVVGQIVTRGPSVTRGYFRDPERTAEAYKAIVGDAPGEAPWLHTGDLGYLASGRLFVCGRQKDLIIVRGRNYHPSDIEWAVSDVPGVRRGSVVAFSVMVSADGSASASAGDERLVVCCEGAAMNDKAIVEGVTAIVSSRFGLTAHEVAVVAPASLPRTSSGKLRRRDARAGYLAGTLLRASASGEAPAQRSDSPGDDAGL